MSAPQGMNYSFRDAQISHPKWAKLAALVEKAVAVLQRHALPNGLSDHDALSELYSIFDGPEYREALLNTPAKGSDYPAGFRAACAAAVDLLSREIDGDSPRLDGTLTDLIYLIEHLPVPSRAP